MTTLCLPSVQDRKTRSPAGNLIIQVRKEERKSELKTLFYDRLNLTAAAFSCSTHNLPSLGSWQAEVYIRALRSAVCRRVNDKSLHFTDIFQMNIESLMVTSIVTL